MKKVVIPYFSNGIKYTTPLLGGGAAYLIFVGHPLWAGLLILLGAIILTTAYVTEIDPAKREYRDYLSVMGFAVDEERSSYIAIQKIIITKKNHSQMLNSRSRSRQLDWSMFTATIVFDNDQTLDLLTRNERSKLLTEIKPFAETLKTDVEDQITAEPFHVDLSKY